MHANAFTECSERMAGDGIPPTVRANPLHPLPPYSLHTLFFIFGSPTFLSIRHPLPIPRGTKSNRTPIRALTPTYHHYLHPRLLPLPSYPLTATALIPTYRYCPRRFGVTLAHCPKKKVEEYESPIPAILIYLKFVWVPKTLQHPAYSR